MMSIDAPAILLKSDTQLPPAMEKNLKQLEQKK